MPFTFKQLRRQFSSLQRRKHLRRTPDLTEQLFISRRRISNTITSAYVGRENPEHRTTGSRSQIAFEECFEPIELRSTIVSLDTHTKLTKHQRLSNRKRSCSAILDELFQRLR